MISKQLKQELLDDTIEIMGALGIAMRNTQEQDGEITYREGKDDEPLGFFLWYVGGKPGDDPMTRIYKDPIIFLRPRITESLIEPPDGDDYVFSKSIVVHELTHYLQVEAFEVLQGWNDYHKKPEKHGLLAYYEQKMEFEAFTVCAYYYFNELNPDKITDIKDNAPSDDVFRKRLIDEYLVSTGGIAVFNC